MHAQWRKSTFSGGNDADCVEVAYTTDVQIRDSKAPRSGSLRLPSDSWSPHRLAQVHPQWRKSTFSSGDEADCVEVAYTTDVQIRDSKAPHSGSLRLPADSWSPHRLTELSAPPA